MEGIGIIRGSEISRNILEVERGSLAPSLSDPLVRIAILTVIAGYQKCNRIFSRGSTGRLKKMGLEFFLSYILNDRDFAPVKFNIRISTISSQKKREEKTGEVVAGHGYNCVILFSGGFDSSSALLYALDRGWSPLLLWVGFGQKNEATEERIAKKLAKKFGRKLVVVRLKLRRYVNEGWKEWSYITPGRNFMFASLAASILAGSREKTCRILMGVTREEYYHSDPCVDKSPYFFRYATQLFSGFYNKKIHVTTPFKSVSKAELAAHWKNHWFKKYGYNPHETVSCYFGKNCGVCNSCFKRSISFLAAGIGLDKDLKKNPFGKRNSAFLKLYLERVFGRVGRKTKLSKKRAVETLIAYRKSSEFLPIEVKKMIRSLPVGLTNILAKEEEKLSRFVWR